MNEGVETPNVWPNAWPMFAGLWIAMAMLLGAVFMVHFY